MPERRERILGNHPVRTGLVILGAFAAGVVGKHYNKAHEDVTPIRIPAHSRQILSPAADTLVVNMPKAVVSDFDCGESKEPIPFPFGEDTHNKETLVYEVGSRAVVQCDLAADVPIIGAGGHLID